MSLSADKILEECVGAIGPYLDQLVVAGGWVPYLYVKLYEGPATHEPLLTVDFDAAIARHEFVERALDELSHCSYHTETKTAATYLATMFADITSLGTEHVVAQRPQTAYTAMTDDQFRRYCMHRMSELREALL